MDAPRALRVYRGPDDPEPFMGVIESLSFQCRNMANNAAPGGIQTLTSDLPIGKVTVMRVGAMGGALYGMEFVTTEAIGGLMQIILSSAKEESYGVSFVLTKDSCIINDKIRKISLPATYFSDTYIDPNYDKRVETCPFIFTLNHKTFIVVISGENVYQAPTRPRDDWHNNNFVNDPSVPVGSHFLTYYEACTRRMLSEAHISYSFSPYTYAAAVLSHIERYINHANRLYIPILGRGDTFNAKYPKFSECEGFPFGKKPFTITADGISTYREVVKVDTVIPLADPLNFNLQIFWPFVPYIYEIPYLNLQYLSGSIFGALPLMASLQEIGSICSYKMQHNTAEDAVDSTSLRSDVATGSFPATATSQTTSTTLDSSEGIVSGDSEHTERQSYNKTYNIKKSATIGTVGGLKDLFVETELNGSLAYGYSLDSELHRVSDFPGIYYRAEFVDDSGWLCGPHNDTTDAEETFSVNFTNNISGTQTLQAGDVVIDSGSIAMLYSSLETGAITHNGSASHDKPCALCASIGYTSQQMSTSGTQTLTCLDSDGNPITDHTCIWAVKSGGGSITSDGIYTAPATNAECANNPVISLTCEGVEIDTLALAINALAGVYNIVVECKNRTCPDPCTAFANCGYCQRWFTCNGARSIGGTSANCNCLSLGTWDQFAQGGSGTCLTGAGVSEGFTDLRSAAQKTSGCCPQQLL